MTLKDFCKSLQEDMSFVKGEIKVIKKQIEDFAGSKDDIIKLEKVAACSADRKS